MEGARVKPGCRSGVKFREKCKRSTCKWLDCSWESGVISKERMSRWEEGSVGLKDGGTGTERSRHCCRLGGKRFEGLTK